jgi:hypothetical protein
METTKKVIAANAGFDLILPNAVRRGGFEAHPIVGWIVECLTNTAFTLPVTLHGSHRDLPAVRYPDGTICVDSKMFAEGEEKAALAYVEKRRDDNGLALERAYERGAAR